MTAPLLVIGAGPTGLGCATELATARPVELIDRIPVPGGEAGWGTGEVNAAATPPQGPKEAGSPEGNGPKSQTALR